MPFPITGHRLAVFIDGANLYATSRALEFDIDYARLRDLVSENPATQLVRIFYYSATLDDNSEHQGIRPLLDYLDYNGFTVVTKPVKEYVDANGRRKVKGNMDIELAIDALEMANTVDEVIIFSGDGDFSPLVQALKRKGVRVNVASTLKGNTPMIADDLRRQADHFIEIANFIPKIKRIETDASAPRRTQKPFAA